MSALGQTAAIRQRMLNYLQRLILIVEFDASRATRFSSCMIPVETITSPCNIFLRSKNILLRERASPLGRIFHARLLPVFLWKAVFSLRSKNVLLRERASPLGRSFMHVCFPFPLESF